MKIHTIMSLHLDKFILRSFSSLIVTLYNGNLSCSYRMLQIIVVITL